MIRHDPLRQPVSILVADRTRAQLFEACSEDRALTAVEVLDHPKGHLRDHELLSDAAGLSVGAGYRQGAPTLASSPHELEAERFAEQIAHRLGELRTANLLKRLYLVAEPHFLGLLRAALDEPTRRLVAGEVHSRLNDLDPHALRAALPALL